MAAATYQDILDAPNDMVAELVDGFREPCNAE
jgi:hypothetical protein